MKKKNGSSFSIMVREGETVQVMKNKTKNKTKIT